MKTFKKFLLENDSDHEEALNRTGFWGKQGAGCLILAKKTEEFLPSGKILVPLRSSAVLQPNTWGVWGGAIDSDEDPKIAAKREVEEEAGYRGDAEMIPLAVFKSNNFKYYNFLAIVETEFRPRINWETRNYRWVTFDELQELEPLHFGLKYLLDNSGQKIIKIIDDLRISED